MKLRRTTTLTLAVLGATWLAAACGNGPGEGAADRSASSDETVATSDARDADGAREGWRSRTDDGDTTRSAVRLEPVDGGMRVRPGPRAVYWRSGDTARGGYRVDATFAQLERVEVPESYGLFVGGRDLEGAEQDYLYFLVRQTGEYLVKHRAGEETHGLVPWTEHAAVRSFEEGADSLVNELAVESREDRVRFLVNGTPVDSLERVEMLNTDGVFGARVNHRVHVRIMGLEHREQRP